MPHAGIHSLINVFTLMLFFIYITPITSRCIQSPPPLSFPLPPYPTPSHHINWHPTLKNITLPTQLHILLMKLMQQQPAQHPKNQDIPDRPRLLPSLTLPSTPLTNTTHVPNNLPPPPPK